MRIKIIAVGRIKEDSIRALASDYIGRISHDAKLDVLELKDTDPEEEGIRIIQSLEKIKENCFAFALGEEGVLYDSSAFSSGIKQLSDDMKTIVFIIGGPDGLHDDVKKRAGKILSLSRMTFTHEMARLFLLEQIYRAISIIKKSPYHR